MTWYDGTSSDGGQPPPPPSVPGGGMPPFPPQPPAQPPGPPAGAPAGGSTSSKRGLIILGVTAAAVVVLGAGFVVTRGPSEVSAREWIRGACADFDDGAFEDAADDVIWDYEYSSISKRDAEKHIAARQTSFALLEQHTKKLKSYNSGHIVDRSDGDEFREDYDEHLSDLLEQIRDGKEELAQLDPSDREEAVAEANEIAQELDYFDFSDTKAGERLYAQDDDGCLA